MHTTHVIKWFAYSVTQKALEEIMVWHSSVFSEKLKISEGIISVSRKMLGRTSCLMEPISMTHGRSLSFLTDRCHCKVKGAQHNTRRRRNKLCGFCERKMTTQSTLRRLSHESHTLMLGLRCWWDVWLDLHAPWWQWLHFSLFPVFYTSMFVAYSIAVLTLTCEQIISF